MKITSNVKSFLNSTIERFAILGIIFLAITFVIIVFAIMFNFPVIINK